MHDGSQVRVFKQKPVIRLTVCAVLLCSFVSGVWFTYSAYVGDDPYGALGYSIVAWLVAIVAGLLCPSYLNYVVVADDRITFVVLLRKTTIFFRDVTELKSIATQQLISISDSKNCITCYRAFSDIDELIELLEARVLPHLESQDKGRQQQLVDTISESRYPKSAWRAMMIIWSVCSVIYAFASVAVTRQMQAEGWAPERGGWIGFFTSFVFLAISIGGAILTYLDRGKVVVLEDDALVYLKWGKTTRIAYSDIERIERRSAWQSVDDIVIIWDNQELELPHDVQRFDELVSRLNAVVPITRKKEETVRFPLEVRARLWWAVPIFLMVFGIMLVSTVIYLALGQSASELHAATVATFLFHLFFGSSLFALGARIFVTCPKRAYFDNMCMKLFLAFGSREYTSGQVEYVRLREQGRGSNIARRLELRIAGRVFRFYSGNVSVSIVPLYELLCMAYWPEGYREPGVKQTTRSAEKP